MPSKNHSGRSCAASDRRRRGNDVTTKIHDFHGSLFKSAQSKIESGNQKGDASDWLERLATEWLRLATEISNRTADGDDRQ